MLSRAQECRAKNKGFRPGGADSKSSLGSGGSAIRRSVYLKVSGDIVAKRCWMVQQRRGLMASQHQRADEAVKPCSFRPSNDSDLKNTRETCTGRRG